MRDFGYLRKHPQKIQRSLVLFLFLTSYLNYPSIFPAWLLLCHQLNILIMLVNLRKNREHHKQNSQPQPQSHFRANTPTDLKTYRASKPQQDQCSICPSIDKVKLTEQLEEQSQGSENMHEVPVEELIAQSKLKNKALEKASYMIKLLEEENQELLSQVGYLQTLLKDRDRQIQALQEEIKQMKPSESRALIRQLMNERQQNNKQGSQGIINITNQFYTFSQHRDRSFSRKSQSKIVNLDHPSFKDMNNDINISKKLTPYASRNHIEDSNTSITNLLASLSVMIVKEGIGNSRVVMEEINELIVAQEQEQEQIMLDLQALEQEIDMQCELPHSPETSKVSRRLFTLEKSPSSDPSSVSQLLEKYQRCIQGYKEYAAYLRAHLCESINFLAQQSLLPARLELNWLPNFLKITARDFSKSLKKRTRQLQEQNCQLKRIMQQLIHNIQLTQYPSSLHKSY